jgi:hypothetical protein
MTSDESSSTPAGVVPPVIGFPKSHVEHSRGLSIAPAEWQTPFRGSAW